MFPKLDTIERSARHGEIAEGGVLTSTSTEAMGTHNKAICQLCKFHFTRDSNCSFVTICAGNVALFFEASKRQSDV